MVLQRQYFFYIYQHNSVTSHLDSCSSSDSSVNVFRLPFKGLLLISLGRQSGQYQSPVGTTFKRMQPFLLQNIGAEQQRCHIYICRNFEIWMVQNSVQSDVSWKCNLNFQCRYTAPAIRSKNTVGWDISNILVHYEQNQMVFFPFFFFFFQV